MQTVGLIVEYNPMHNGHLYHLQQSKQIADADAVVAVMSGHFLQRGEPALLDKWARADMALANGLDLVLELPTAYAVQPAEWFAHGAVATLAATGVVDAFCFGSELGELAPLASAAQRLTRENSAFAARLRDALKQGVSYPAAYAQAAATETAAEGGDAAVDASWLAEPNNSLGLHYMMASERLQSAMKPYTIQRVAAGYHDTTAHSDSIASATAVRRLIHHESALAAEPFLPFASQEIINQWTTAGKHFGHWESYAASLFYRLSTSCPESLNSILEVTEGLEHRILHTLPQLSEWRVQPFLEALKTKRYTLTKLQRMLTHILLNHTKEDFGPEALQCGPHYIRVLGFSQKGQALLKKMKKSASLPIVHTVTRENNMLGGAAGLAADVRATAVYAAGISLVQGRTAYRDFYEPPRRCHPSN
ncbi:nucleotidyltransferase [Paenibacillus sp. SC116]|uniref:nucleotidyltransferase n=1 Tax=Paenibacillus sp. SC116 TaxID=2968986 RepID=UPI00215B4388|nr:nucleotidyltransferase [Paenibacillus sp. SC116]MCR8845400.1 nucleotidyltransferase [Paenibacillus sp. SC116]